MKLSQWSNYSLVGAYSMETIRWKLFDGNSSMETLGPDGMTEAESLDRSLSLSPLVKSEEVVFAKPYFHPDTDIHCSQIYLIKLYSRFWTRRIRSKGGYLVVLSGQNPKLSFQKVNLSQYHHHHP